MKKKYDVVSVGLQCIDIVSSRVGNDILQRDLTIVDSVQLGLGGDALNQAVVLSRLGARAAVMGVVGNDSLGDVLLDALAKKGVDVLAKRADVNTTISIVLPDENGERHFIYQPSSNHELCYRHIDEAALGDTAFLSIGGCMSLPKLDGEDTLRLLHLAHNSGARTAIDFKVSSPEFDRQMIRDTLKAVDYVLPSEWEASVLTGERADPMRMAEGLHDLGAKNCIIKLGENGCYVSADGYEGRIPAYACRCIDTTGAGDTFVGAFLYAMVQGWSIERCARFANAAGSIAVEHPGANDAIQSLRQVLSRMEESK